MMFDIEDGLKQCSRDTTDKMEKITSSKKSKEKVFDIKEWISSVEWDGSVPNRNNNNIDEVCVLMKDPSDNDRHSDIWYVSWNHGNVLTI